MHGTTHVQTYGLFLNRFFIPNLLCLPARTFVREPTGIEILRDLHVAGTTQ